MICIRFEAVFK